MQDLFDYAYLTADKSRRDQALDDYENLGPQGGIDIVSHDQAISNLCKIKHKLGDLIAKLPKNLMISGSTALACVMKNSNIIPHDVDIYINDNDHDAICQIDAAIRLTYENTDIIIIRTQYTINWFLKDTEKYNYPRIQLILPPARHWSEVFSSYHCDLVCIGFLVGEKKFVYGRGRWDRFYKTGVSLATASFTDDEYAQKAYDAFDKYRSYGFDINIVNTTDKIVSEYREMSPKIQYDTTIFEDIEAFIEKYPNFSIGKYIHNVYHGEIFKDYLEAMSIFHRCPNCGKMIVSKKICDPCATEEALKLKFIKETLKNSPKDLRYLITGGRCGLGNEISNILLECGRDVTVTTRFPKLVEGKKTIQLDLKNRKSVENFEKEVVKYDILILSAAETLHFLTDPPLDAKEKGKLDWTNDVQRNDTGVWHKCIDEHSNEEIEDPIEINITSIAKIIRTFVAHQIQNKSSTQKSIVYVTSSEGLFAEKSPFHPVTNMTKAAIEQLICTMKRQADILGMNIVMADPGWMYTKSTIGKNIGPITLEWGASQILLPIAEILNGQKVLNASLWSRRNKDSFTTVEPFEPVEIVKFKGFGEICPTTLDESNVMMELKPCKHQIGLKGWYQMKKMSPFNVKCPLCRAEIETTEVVQLENPNHMFIEKQGGGDDGKNPLKRVSLTQ